VSNEKTVRMFMFTCNLVIRQQVGELLNKANNLRRPIHCQENR